MRRRGELPRALLTVDGVVAVHPVGAGSAGAPGTDLRPPGDRYYRHPGDAVRLVLWGFTVVGLATFMGRAHVSPK